MTIAFFCGDSHESWSPKSVATGIGGSEEAVIYLAQEFVKLGHKVTVWNNCGSDEGKYDGVQYRDYIDYDESPVDIMIGWRSEGIWKHAQNYTLGYHWLHDTVEEQRALVAQALGASKIMVLSKFHRRLYPKLRNSEIFLTRNGIVPEQFQQKVERVPGRVFYGSSYDRGLKEILEEWPKIKLAVPHATLHIAYGWQTWEKIASGQEEGAASFKRVKDAMEEQMQQEGIVHLGRISHEQVAKEMLEADVWGYPTWWPEISCITAMKAQAGGAIPVVIPTAAVAETVQVGYKTDRGYYMDIEGNPAVRPKEALDQWTGAVIRYLQMPEEEKAPLREQMQAIDFSWSGVAKEWEKEFDHALIFKGLEKKREL